MKTLLLIKLRHNKVHEKDRSSVFFEISPTSVPFVSHCNSILIIPQLGPKQIFWMASSPLAPSHFIPPLSGVL